MYSRLIFVVLLLFTISCSKDESIEIVHGSYPADVEMGQFVKRKLEEKFHKSVKITELSSAYIFSALATGTADISTSVWLPTIHKGYVNTLGERIKILGTLYEDVKVGLAVHGTNPINSIEELKKYSEQFEYLIHSIEPGAGLVIQAQETIDAYNLDNWKIQAGSEATMLAVFNEEPWSVITAWSPHEMNKKWNLKFLKDPKRSFGSKERICIACRKDFSEEYPEIAEFLTELRYKK